MRLIKNISRITGFLFLMGTASGIVAVLFNPAQESLDYRLTFMAENSSSVLISAAMVLLMAFACAGIGFGLARLVKDMAPGLSLTIAGFRLMEAVLGITAAMLTIFLLVLSRKFPQGTACEKEVILLLFSALESVDQWLSNGVMLMSWGIAASLYYSLFFRYGLVPRWLSLWGLIGISMMLIASVLVILELVSGFGTVQVLMNLPIAIQEMVFAFWLIIKGVNKKDII